MVSSVEIHSDNFMITQDIDSALNRMDTSFIGVCFETHVQQLKAFGIAFSIIGLLLVAGGIAVTIALSNPMFLLLVLTGLILTVLAGIVLIKAELIKYRRMEERTLTIEKYDELCLQDILETEFPHTTEQVSVESIVRLEEDELCLQDILRTGFPHIIETALQYDQGHLVRKVFTNGKGIYLAFAQGFLENIRFNPFGDRAKTVVICEASSSAEIAIRRCVNKSSLQVFQSAPILSSGESAYVNWSSSNEFEERFPGQTPWSLLCLFQGIFLDTRAYTPIGQSEEAYNILKLGFINLFRFCIEQNTSVVQMPLLSYNPEWPTDEKDAWDAAVVTVVLDALSDLYVSTGSSHSLCVNIVNPDELPVYRVIKDM